MKKDGYTLRITEALRGILHHLPSSSAAEETAFVEQFYANIPLSELEIMAGDHATELARDAFRFFEKRTPGEPKIRIFVPTKDKNGYQVKHVAIELLNDDKPFLVDSLTNELTRLGFTIFATFHPILKVLRDPSGELKAVVREGDGPEGTRRESLIHFEISSLPDDLDEAALEQRLRTVLNFVSLAVADWQAIVVRGREVRQSLANAKTFSAKVVSEAETFLDWLMSRNFVFLGYAGITQTEASAGAQLDRASFLGISKIDDIPAEVNPAPHLVDVRKAERYSLVHRRVLMDVIIVKRIEADGAVTGEHRFYGLFTSAAYYQSAENIPLVGPKTARIIARAGFDPASHNGKALRAILQFLPRDELFQIEEDELFDLSMRVLGLESRPGVKLFARIDVARRYISALVFVPRELFSTDVRKHIQHVLEKSFKATQETYATQIEESPLARLHVVLRTTSETPAHLELQPVEQEIATTIMLWSDKLKEALIQRYGDHAAERLFRLYSNAFSPAYIHSYDLTSTLNDIEKMEQCCSQQAMELELYTKRDEHPSILHLKIYSFEQEIALSDILPLLGNMGLRVLDEYPHVIRRQGEAVVRMRDIRLQLPAGLEVDASHIKMRFETLLLEVWRHKAENDALNSLVLTAGLDHQQIAMLRAYGRYLKQIGFTYSQSAIHAALNQYAAIAALLVQWFETRFNPDTPSREKLCNVMRTQLEEAFNTIATLADDRILRTMAELINVTLRTNYYIRTNGQPRPILSFKFDSINVPGLPLPKPFAEIYVYSTRIEGIHLRGGKVARGGLRWSDRHEDFRTEVLGLMKAQMVKNAVIVPVGSKGGFVVRQVSPQQREAFRQEGTECYKLYLQGLLDITDNIKNGAIVPPAQVVRYDGDDPYLVVAADKGTAQFSDTANAVSQSYDFWLDDAFASGGSAGYDHKKMGITARGAWVSVERHFREMGIDITSTPFTVVGIGDMSGDVFGNGMLLSKYTKLVAAFNHMHIFLDPNPDPARSFAERKRLFELSRSAWTDYDKDLISTGGGVYSRDAKSVRISAEMKAVLQVERDEYSPDELIQVILKAPVDLLFNGGIGTYVKATSETHEQVGDRTNNALRVNGAELRCKVVGEGGNLGFTQLGRIEYAHTGGRINTDAIDNSGGVDCSDHEVNIKIALQTALQGGKITLHDRNELLAQMTDEVAALVLRDNALQTQALTTEELQAPALLESHTLLIRALEARGLLNRSIEFLPTDAELEEFHTSGRGLTRPQLAVLLAYSKIALFKDIVESSLPDEPYFASDLARYFPNAMKERFVSEIKSHTLRREIISTVATNSMVNRAGIGFYFNIAESTKLPARDIVAAYTVTRDIFQLRGIWDRIEALSGKISAHTQSSMYAMVTALLSHMTHWMLRTQKLPLDMETIIRRFSQSIQELSDGLPAMLGAQGAENLSRRVQELVANGVPLADAQRVAATQWLNGAGDICEIAGLRNRKLAEVAQGYFSLGERLKLDALRNHAARIAVPSRWDRLALQSLLFEYDHEHRRITDRLVHHHKGDMDAWATSQSQPLGRYMMMVEDMLAREQLTTPMLMVLLKQLQQIDTDV